MEELKRFIHHLNPYAQILQSQFGQVELKSVLGTGNYNEEWAEGHPNWLAVPRGSEQSEVDEYGIESFIFEARRPFHPERFALALSFDDGTLAGVMRQKVTAGSRLVIQKSGYGRYGRGDHDCGRNGFHVRLRPTLGRCGYGQANSRYRRQSRRLAETP